MSALAPGKIPIASSPLPCFVSKYASSAQAALARVPGIRSNAPEMSPAKIAIDVLITIATSAGTGGMKKVTGINKATAIVAVSPGIAPTKRPKIVASKPTPNV